jgi:prophage maintenance system killer protein
MMAEGKKLSKRDSLKYRLSKSDLLSANSIKQANLEFLINAKKGAKNTQGEKTQYLLHDMSFNQMKKYILNLPVDDLNKILWHFPEKSNLFHQCAYYFRAFSRSQIFLDANHRTGYFTLKIILKKMGIDVTADANDITSMTEYVKAQGWLALPDMDVSLKEKDEEFRFLVDWFEERLQFR